MTLSAKTVPLGSLSGQTVTILPAIGDQSTLSSGAPEPNMMQVAAML